MKRKPSLTPKQRQFVEEFLVDMNARAAAKRAGYSDRYAHTYQIMQVPTVRAYIEQRQKELSDKLQISQEYVLNGFKKIADKGLDDPTYDARAAAEALKWLGKHLGLFVEKHQHEVNGILTVNLTMEPFDE